MKRECRIILPATAGHVPLANLSIFETSICQIANGFTCFEAHGNWLDGDKFISEDVFVYDIAVDGLDAEHDLKQLAIKAAETFNQECIYFRYRDGTVELLTGKGEVR